MAPADLSIIPGGPAPQACLSLRHVSRVTAVMITGAKLLGMDLVVCYVTDRGYIETAEREWTSYATGESRTTVSLESNKWVIYIIVHYNTDISLFSMFSHRILHIFTTQKEAQTG